MKLPRRRRLRWPFWMSSVVAVVVLGGMVVGTVTSVYWFGPRHAVFLSGGAISIATHEGAFKLGFGSGLFDHRFFWGPQLWPREFILPLYLLAAPFVLFSTISFIRAPLKRAEGHCPHCNYDRAGLANDVACPECGKGTR